MSQQENIRRVLAIVEEVLRARGRETGAALGTAIRREMPAFDSRTFGSLTRLLLDNAENLVVVDRSGADWVWALGDRVSDRDIERALGTEPEPEDGQAAIGPSNARLARVELQNFRGCRDTRLDLSETGLTVLVGPNGAGKSTVLSGVSFVSQVTRGRLAALFAGPRDLRRLRTVGVSEPVTLAATMTTGETLRVVGFPDDETRFELRIAGGKGKAETYQSPGDRPKVALARRPWARALWPSVFLRFRSEALSAPSEVTEGEPRLGFDGYGLPSVLAHLANTDPGRLEQVVEEVRRLVPSVRKTRQRTRRWEPGPTGAGDPEPPTSVIQYQLEVEIDGFGWVPADLLSEGTLFAFGMHAILQQASAPRILLMDDIDRALHPRAQRTLIQQLETIADQGVIRLVVSTHSPYVLDQLDPECVRVVRSGGASGTLIRPLTEHPEWDQWSAQMTPGEFWAYAGEDWLEKGT